MLFSTADEPFYIPSNSAQGLQFLHIITNNCYFSIVTILMDVRWYHRGRAAAETPR